MNSGAGPWLRFLLAAGMLVAAAVFLQARSGREVVPGRQPLENLPRTLGPWTGRDVGIDASVREILGPGDFLSRIYRNPEGAWVDLFVGYFASQRTGNAIHSPKNCLPGSGWLPVESGTTELPSPDGRTLVVNRYIIGKGLDRQLVFYWYQAHDRVVASEYWAKFYLVSDAIATNRTDGALVRIVIPIPRDDTGKAEDRAREFARQLLPHLSTYIPR